MNRWCGTGRLTKDPDIKTTQDGVVIARFTVACDRRFKRENQSADFISCIAFNKTAEFMEKYFTKGMKIEVDGRIQTGSYEKDGVKHYTTDIVCESVGFGESKKKGEESAAPIDEGFVNVPDDINTELPFA